MSHIGMICERKKHALNDKTKTNQINFEKTKIRFFLDFLKFLIILHTAINKFYTRNCSTKQKNSFFPM